MRAVPGHWQQMFGYRPLLAESFTDPETYEGTCYKASNWEAAGHSAGYSRHRADFYVDNDHPKRLWLRELDPQARRHLRSAVLPADCQPGVIAPPPRGSVRRPRNWSRCLRCCNPRRPIPAPRTPVIASAPC